MARRSYSAIAVLLLVVASAGLGCNLEKRRPLHDPGEKTQISEEVLANTLGRLTRRAIDGNTEAIAELFTFAVRTDGGATEMLADPYLLVLASGGERAFARELRNHPVTVRDAVLRIMGDYVDRRTYLRMCDHCRVEPRADEGHHMEEGHWYVPPVPIELTHND